jgi:hypothetical protein
MMVYPTTGLAQRANELITVLPTDFSVLLAVMAESELALPFGSLWLPNEPEGARFGSAA